MAAEWPVRPISEMSNNLDARRKPVKEAERIPGPYPYYGASGIVDFVDGYLFDGEYVLVAEDGENLRTRNTPIAFRATGRFWVNNHAHILQGNERARTRFLEYALLATDISGYLTGAVMPKLTQGNLGKIEVPCPPLQAQDEIVGVLGAIDDRIDNLRQTNATLEAIAQALFKSWFVDFDPVHAKAEGREPEGMDAATAALFPSEFEDSELGPIPKGWRRVSFGDVATLSKGSVSPMATPAQEFQHYSLPAFDAGQLPLTELGEAIKSNKTPVPSNAVLVSKLNPHIPRIWFVGDTGPHAVCSTEFLVWTPKPGVSSAFVYTLAASTAFNSAMRQLVTGTSNSHQRVKPAQLAEIQTATISTDALARFDAIAAPLLQQVVHNRRRAAVLAETRDTLLPRLISGKLRLPWGATEELSA